MFSEFLCMKQNSCNWSMMNGVWLTRFSWSVHVLLLLHFQPVQWCINKRCNYTEDFNLLMVEINTTVYLIWLAEMDSCPLPGMKHETVTLQLPVCIWCFVKHLPLAWQYKGVSSILWCHNMDAVDHIYISGNIHLMQIYFLYVALLMSKIRTWLSTFIQWLVNFQEFCIDYHIL